ncbi:MAG: hypothetical protein R8G66_29605 [Cytophagales bacterium]|nr:hypothetical protein [Cytophagales bacterium]
MIKKYISFWIVTCLLLVAASNNQSHESNSVATGQAPVSMAFNH